MLKLRRHFAKFTGWVAQFFRYRAVYCTWNDRWRVFLLKFSTTGLGRRVFSAKLCHLPLRVWPQGVHLRWSGSDILVLQEIFEERIYRTVEHWQLRSQPTILDLGGNIGLATIYFSTVFPKAKVVVVEPEAANRKLLELNCAELISGERLKVAGSFVGGRDGFAGLDRDADSWAFRKTDEHSAATEQIECVTMPTLMQRFDVGRIDLLKCDIEGSEVELFADCGSWIRAVDFLIVETHGQYRLKDLYADLQRAGWRFKIHRELQTEREGLCYLEQTGRVTKHVQEGSASLLEPTAI